MRTRRSLAALLGVAVAGLVGSVGWAQGASAQPPSHPPIVVLAVPGLVWSDVLAMPNLQSLAARSAVGELSVKTSGGVTRCAAGLIGLSAGNRTESPAQRCRFDMATWPSLIDLNRSNRYDARVGGLGSTLRAHSIPTVAVGARAVPMLADLNGSVTKVVPTLRKALSIGGVIAILDPRLYVVTGPARRDPVAAVDAEVATIERQLPAGTTLMVAGVSDRADGHADLHTIVISGPGWPHTELKSPTTGRAPFVELIDIAPTILRALALPIPSSMVGLPMQPNSTTPPGTASFVDDNRHATEQRTLGQRVFLALGIAAVLMMVLAAGRWRIGRQSAMWLARLIAPAPALIFLVNAAPWWRWGQLWYAAILLGGCVAVGSVTTVVARRDRSAAILVPAVFCFSVLVIDQLLGAPLQISAPLGDSPLIAGRFTGMGNLDFAAMGASAMVVAGVLAGRLSRQPGILAATVIAGIAIVVDGAPQLGNDIGGVLALVPASLVLVALVTGITITLRRVLAVGVSTLVVAVGVALIDYSRPATSQTHVGRFVGQVLHGGAGTEVRRKLDSAVASVGLTIGTLVVVVAVALAIGCRARIRQGIANVPGGAAAAASAVTVAAVGVAVNDSGITIAAMAATVTVGALYGGGYRASVPDSFVITDAPTAAPS